MRWFFSRLLHADWRRVRWERRVDHLGRPYYVDHNTRTTTWKRPSWVIPTFACIVLDTYSDSAAQGVLKSSRIWQIESGSDTMHALYQKALTLTETVPLFRIISALRHPFKDILAQTLTFWRCSTIWQRLDRDRSRPVGRCERLLKVGRISLTTTLELPPGWILGGSNISVLSVLDPTFRFRYNLYPSLAHCLLAGKCAWPAPAEFTSSITTPKLRPGTASVSKEKWQLHALSTDLKYDIDPRLPSSLDQNVPQYKRDFRRKLIYFRSQPALRPVPGQCHIKVRRDHIFEDAYAEIMRQAPADLRKRLMIKFDGEDGLDYGGLSREFFFLLSHEMFNPFYW